MLFNFEKCKSPTRRAWKHWGELFMCKTVKEKDLAVGLTMNANKKVSVQCRIAASKGNHMLGMIRGKYNYKEK